MYMDVVDLRSFYQHTLGQVAQRLIGDKIQRLWPVVTGDVILGLGFAVPYLGLFSDQARLTVALMPAGQGAICWPKTGRGLSALVDDCGLPLADSSVDKILIVHGLEHAEDFRAMLEDAYRVLAPSGELVVVVANRRGLWARFDNTPFGHGRPFSRGQMAALLDETGFSPAKWGWALSLPPLNRPFFLRSAPAWERIGHFAWARFSGVMVVSARKQIYAVRPSAPAARVSRRLVPKPVMPMAPFNKTK